MGAERVPALRGVDADIYPVYRKNKLPLSLPFTAAGTIVVCAGIGVDPEVASPPLPCMPRRPIAGRWRRP